MSNNILYKIRQDISPAKLFEAPKLQYVCLKINDLCNAKCSFCDIWLKQVPSHPDINWLEVVDDLIYLKAEEINIHGGEAFLSKCFFPMLEHGGDRTSFSIITNGALLDRFYDKLFRHNIKRIYISIDHVDPALNALSRGIKKLEHMLYPTIERISKEQTHVELIVNHVITKNNIDTISNFVLKAKQLGFKAVNLIPIKDTPELCVSKEQIFRFYESLQLLINDGLVSSSDFLNGFYKIFGDESTWDFAAKGIYNVGFKRACIIPAAAMFINGPDGNVYPCDTTKYRPNSEQYVMGNVLHSSVRDIWSSTRLQEFRAKMYPKITCNCIKGCDPANSISVA